MLHEGGRPGSVTEGTSRSLWEMSENDNDRLTRIARKNRPADAPAPALMRPHPAGIFRRLRPARERQARAPATATHQRMTTPRERRRSVAFLESRDDTWACFLVTAPRDGGAWHGYFSFRPSYGETEKDEVRTADIFIEASELEIYDKARGLGRPLLAGLLESALYTRDNSADAPQRLRGRFRSLLVENATEIAGDWPDPAAAAESREADRLRSLYASYRLDQVAHFICLVEPSEFEAAVDRILEGESIDFLSKDRMQYAMMVVDHIENLLPLPDFETWAKDYLGHPEAYRLYAHILHREGRLP